VSTNENREPGKPRPAIWRRLTELVASAQSPEGHVLRCFPSLPRGGAEGPVLRRPPSTSRGETEGNRRTARLLSALLLVIFLATMIRVIYTAFASKVPPVVLATCVVTGIAYGLSHTRYYTIAASLTVIALSMPSFVAAAGEVECSEPMIRTRLVWLILPLILSSILLPPRGAAIVAVLNFVGILLLPALNPEVTMGSVAGSLGLVGTASALIVISMYHRNQLERDRRARLEESERRYRTLFESAGDAIFIHSPAGPILEVNEVACERLGYTREELLQMTPMDVGSSEHASMVPERVTELLRQGHLVFETEHVRRDGTRIPTEIGSRMIEYRGQPAVLSIARDITKRRRTQEALLRERDLVARITETSPAGVVQIDRFGQITFANLTAQKVLGLTVDEITQRNYNAPEWRITDYEGKPFPEDQLPFAQVMRTGQSVFDVRHAIEWSDGQRVLLSINAAPLFDEAGQVDSIVTTVEDITERVQLEQELLNERDFAESLIETAQTIVLLLDTEGRIVRFNPYMEEISGYRLEEVQGKDWFTTFLPKQDHAEIRGIFQQAVSDTQTRGNINPIVTKDGGERLVEWYDKTLKDADGNAVGLLAVGQNVTERVWADRALRLYAERLEILHEIHQGILTAQSRQAIAQAAVSRIRQLIPCQRVGVVLIDTETAEAEVAAFDAAIESQIPADVHLPLDELEDVVGQLLQGDVVVFEDLLAQGEIFEIPYTEGVRSAVFFPLLFGSDLIGALTFWLTEDDMFTPDFLGIARQLADQLAIAIQQARLYEQVQRHAEELEGRVAERTAELSRLVDLMTGREIRMAELKEVIEELHTQLEAAGLTPAADDPLVEWRHEP
jgi:PAS domain S-box-containing protein